MTTIINRISEIQDQYHTFFVDLVGVIYDGMEPYEEAIQAINHLIDLNKKIVFISNNPRPAEIPLKKLEKFGIRKPYDVVTSGDYMRHRFETDLSDLTFYFFGASKNHDLLNNIPVKLTDSFHHSDAIILGVFLEESEDIHQFNGVLEEIALSGKPVYCPNPDRRALFGQELRYTAGFFGDIIKSYGGKVVEIGKPSIGMYQFVDSFLNLAEEDKQGVLMIGDTIETDIQGAINFGIDSLLISSGVSGGVDQSTTKPTYMMKTLKY